MIWMFIAGWIGGVIGTLWFGKWYSDRQTMKMFYEVLEKKRSEADEHREKTSV